MTSAPLRPAQLAWRDDGTPFAPEFGDVYHPADGALAQARAVFLAGNGLPRRWRGRADFVVLELGFGLGNNFLATWAAWRDDPERCARLHYLAVELHPPTRADAQAAPRDPMLAPLASELVAAWPLPTPGMHRLAFDADRVQLLIVHAAAAEALREIVAGVDALYLDGFAPDRNPEMWEPHLLKALARICGPGATAATWSAARAVRDALSAAGFEVRREPGPAGKRHVTHARFAPRHPPLAPLPGRPIRREVAAEVLIVGGGLAGCAAALALAELGWHSRVFDRHAQPAAEGSGNPAGLFHGVAHGDDAAHARWNRAAALQAARSVGTALRDGVPGACEGALRLETRRDIGSMRRMAASQGWPAELVQARDADAAAALAGIALRSPAWFHPGGGWVDPSALTVWFLRRSGADWQGGQPVHALQRRGDCWALLDEAGATLATSATVVLANACDAPRLLGAPDWPLESVRGQVSGLPLAWAVAAGIALPRVPIAGAGYVLPPSRGRLWFGATAQPGDGDAALREADHRFNLARLAQLVSAGESPDAADCVGRVAWRCRSRDGLPLIGAVPAADRAAAIVQTRFVPREPGLFVLTGLGSRGITWAPLGARVLASWVAGTPAPVEASLLEAVDPARFAVRAARRAR